MFTAEEIYERLHEEPFRPFRLVVREGPNHEIRSTELVRVGRREVMIGIPDRRSPTIYKSLQRVALDYIVALEDLPDEPAAGQVEGGLGA